MSRITRLGVVFLLLTIPCSGQRQVSRDARQEGTLDRSISISLGGDETTRSAFTSVLALAHAPGGIVQVLACDLEQKYKFAENSRSLRDALDNIVSTAPKHQWQLDDGVINLIPVDDMPPLLNLRIREFNVVENTKTLSHVLDQLFRLPEVQERIYQLRLEEPRIHLGFTDLKRPGTVPDEPQSSLDIHCKNTTLRGALNAIARAHGSAVWSYEERHCNGRHQFRIDFVVQ